MMKKTILLTMALSCSVASAQSFEASSSSSAPNTSVTIPYTKAPTSITQNNNTSTIDTANSVRCPSGENRWLRRFDLDGTHGINDFFDVTSIDFAAQSSDAKNIEVRLYEIPNGDTLDYANMTQIASLSYTLTANSTPAALNAAITGTVTGSTHDLVVELFEDTTVTGTFYPGANSLGQTAPGYIRADSCSVTTPTDITTLGATFANVHLLMVVNGDTRAAVIPPVPSTGSFGVMLMILGMLGLGWFTARRFQ